MKTGVVKAVCTSIRKGTAKKDIGVAKLIENYGLENDAHAGSKRQVSLLSWDIVEAFKRSVGAGIKIEPGSFGENLLVAGYDFKAFPIGTRLQCGDVLLEITQKGKTCHEDCEIRRTAGTCIMPKEGVFAIVLRGGYIKTGDKMDVLTDDYWPSERFISDREDSPVESSEIEESAETGLPQRKSFAEEMDERLRESYLLKRGEELRRDDSIGIAGKSAEELEAKEEIAEIQELEEPEIITEAGFQEGAEEESGEEIVITRVEEPETSFATEEGRQIGEGSDIEIGGQQVSEGSSVEIGEQRSGENFAVKIKGQQSDEGSDVKKGEYHRPGAGRSVFRAAVITVSDRSYRGERDDMSGPKICSMLKEYGYVVSDTRLLPDEEELIYSELVRLSDTGRTDVVFTTGGTGFSERDRTPEATKRAGERDVPGISEAIRAESMKHTKRAMLSRGASVIRGRTLIINLPGSPKAVEESLGFIMKSLAHGIEILRGSASECAGK